MKDPKTEAKRVLSEVCGDMKNPNATDIITVCSHYLANNIRLDDSEDAKGENEDLACMCRNVYIAAYEDGMRFAF